MEELLPEFGTIVQSHTVKLYDVPGDRRTKRLAIVFVDGSRLVTYESLFYDTGRQKYSYQWMTADHELIIRWDNAHPVDLPTSLHHQHIDTEENIQPSEPMTLATVLTAITARL